jgi:hypothetical protein
LWETSSVKSLGVAVTEFVDVIACSKYTRFLLFTIYALKTPRDLKLTVLKTFYSGNDIAHSECMVWFHNPG